VFNRNLRLSISNKYPQVYHLTSTLGANLLGQQQGLRKTDFLFFLKETGFCSLRKTLLTASLIATLSKRDWKTQKVGPS